MWKTVKTVMAIYTLTINYEMSEIPKQQTTSQTYLHLLNCIVLERYANYINLFTDGSKSAGGVVPTADAHMQHHYLRKHLHIFSAKLHATHLALIIRVTISEQWCVIFTDSLNLIQAMQNEYTSNYVCSTSDDSASVTTKPEITQPL